ncbi:hypothetical protein IZ6_22650 [Terrihabitans soli]|uniref:Uncharacterized protein n=1 Tax=Terrihabitans soli TaxID=708113 RepID=A0A6S6QWX2_9HYPH|nr:hypothetical protein [Terrihabitans soli]BCJ91530.1 hypothetical protein IZ6_22650 [Terrihabitans soli]
MFRTVLFAAAALVLVPAVASADKADADACAAKLSGQSKVIYRSVVASVQAGQTLENAVKKAAKPKVDSGKMSEADARKFGKEAAMCARLVHRGA